MIPNLPKSAANAPPIAHELSQCRRCAGEFGFTPRPIVRLCASAPILIISQAPGARAHRSGIPFDDPSGVRLRDWMGLRADRFFAPGTLSIAPMGFCFPGNDANGGDLRPPRRCHEIWHGKVLEELSGVLLTLVIGAMAQSHILGRSDPMTTIVRDWQTYAPTLFPLPHPSWRNSAWLKRNPWFEAETIPALRARVSEVLN
ncbi:uracil-DNA glycosylase [Pontivivens insulae]|nr:uracil-DNA glycosylase [Pontivivens insulae]